MEIENIEAHVPKDAPVKKLFIGKSSKKYRQYVNMLVAYSSNPTYTQFDKVMYACWQCKSSGGNVKQVPPGQAIWKMLSDLISMRQFFGQLLAGDCKRYDLASYCIVRKYYDDVSHRVDDFVKHLRGKQLHELIPPNEVLWKVAEGDRPDTERAMQLIEEKMLVSLARSNHPLAVKVVQHYDADKGKVCTPLSWYSGGEIVLHEDLGGGKCGELVLNWVVDDSVNEEGKEMVHEYFLGGGWNFGSLPDPQ